MSAERLQEAAKVLREAHDRTIDMPEPTELDMRALREAGFGAIFVSPGLALAMADLLEEVAAWREEGLGLIPETNIGDAWIDVEGRSNKLADAILGDPR